MTRQRPHLTLIQGGRAPRDDLAPSIGIGAAFAMSTPFWLPTWWGLCWIAAVARVIVR